mgnify:CR=1 FL=1
MIKSVRSNIFSSNFSNSIKSTSILKATFLSVLIIVLSHSSIAQEISVTDNSLNSITDDFGNSPSLTNSTNFGTVTAGSSLTYTFRIKNVQSGAPTTLTLSNPIFSSNPSTYFTVSSVGSLSLGKNGETTFTITFLPLTSGTFTADIQIDNNDGDENPYNFRVQGVGQLPLPEIEIQGNSTIITDGDVIPSTTDDTDFGSVSTGSSSDHTFTIYNIGVPASLLSLTGGVPLVDISGDASFTILTQPISSTINGGNSLTFIVRFSPLVGGTVTSTISIDNNDSDENPYNFVIQGTGAAPLTKGPGGITTDLQLWLKANDGLAYSDGQSVSLWADQGRGSDATIPGVGLEPTFWDNATYNVNFNPVVDFDNNYNTSAYDFTNSDTSRDVLIGSSGFYSQEIFLITVPDVTVNSALASMDVFCGDADESTNQKDGTGIGFGKYSVRYDDEVLSFAISTTPTTVPPDINDRGYGISHSSTTSTYTMPGIINSRNNSNSPTANILYFNANNVGNTEVGLNNFYNVNNSRFWLGRSEAYTGSYDGRILEVITYNVLKGDTNSADERNKIQSYLAIKYGITLGVNGTSQNYVDSFGNTTWDITANTGFNYDIAGIGRDDDSELNQKQSKSVNAGSLVAIGLGEVATTNNANANSFATDLDFLIWGNNNGNFNTSAEVAQSINLSGSTTTFTPVSKKWKILETQNDVAEVVISLVTSELTSNIPLGANEEYMLVVADNSSFANTAIIDVVPLITNGANSEVWYDFDGVKYFTIAKASRVEEKRRIDFTTGEFLLGDSSLELATNFTVSAWVKNNSSGGSFISKGAGYNFKINGTNNVEIDWNGATKVTSINTIDSNWHHIALTFSGGTGTLYIDGILDTTVNSLANPISSSYKFSVGALYTNKATVSSFDGAVDEIRIWDSVLTVTEIRYIMNQEIEEFGTNVDGEIIPQGIPKNDISSKSWNSLQAYYDMNSFYGTVVEDNSNNKNWVRIKYLNKDKLVVESQTAPLPYESNANGDWDTAGTWLNNTVQYLPNTILNGTKVDWNIVVTSHDITSGDRNITLLGLISDSGKLTVSDPTVTIPIENNAGQSLRVTHYLELDGAIDLVGESQLLQDEDCILDEDSGGFIERDQQGTANSYNYNYWTSSVGPITTGTGSRGTGIESVNAPYSISTVLNDGTSSTTPLLPNFQTAYYAADIVTPSPIILSSYWLWKFNGTSNDYSAWIKINENSSLLPGEGYTMKGTSGLAPIITKQNYVFKGKPNNGTITLPIGVGNNRLIGNPYVSAIDANEFILDNINDSGGRAATNIIDGAIYFWDHFGEINTHILKEYVGGYATYNLIGGVAAISNDVRINATLATSTKIPGQYIPVNQGFFVNADTGGIVTFKNSQRVFETESTVNSVFMKSSKTKSKITETNDDVDLRPKIWLMFDSPTGYHRQLLVGVDENASNNIDIGFDASLSDTNKEDMFWVFDDDKFVIQGVNNFDKDQQLPLGVKVEKEGLATIKIAMLKNIDSKLKLYIKDNETGKKQDITKKPFTVQLEAGEYLDRFSLVFSPDNKPNLRKNENLNDEFLIYMNNNTSELQIIKPNEEVIEKIILFNYLGQVVESWEGNFNEREFSIPIVKPIGVYIVKVTTKNGIISKKIIIN